MTTQNMPLTTARPQGARWAGWIINGLVILFLLFDAIMKIFKEKHTIEASAKLGWPAEQNQAIGLVLLVATILYVIPRTALPGAILLSAYLGGAVAIMVRAGENFIFPILFGILLWVGFYFRNAKFRSLVAHPNGA
ncbi:MAG: DoxX family protein [Bacteroidota bacterium]|nr:DoxX family protein [Bacteroidota bacterium]MDP4215654.1 DoxX family protein [Bacteroidota bacterium]MDP4246533.1 DoxX family protein [Bacteroidota bacterium]MDP4252920.1 DoxX family protein [Bacteroidota bacterium]MDP4259768.1 DoxX family protein [Bacteroidota bacterium]